MSYNDIREHIACISSEDHKRIVHYISQYFSHNFAKNCVQEAYLLALEQANELRNPDKLMKWLVTVAKRIAMRQTKKSGRFRSLYIRENNLFFPSQVILMHEVYWRMPLSER